MALGELLPEVDREWSTSGGTSHLKGGLETQVYVHCGTLQLINPNSMRNNLIQKSFARL